MASIPIADVITTERLPIDAQDVVTKVRLVIAGNRAGWPATRLVAKDAVTDASVTYFADPVVYEYTAPEHAAYGCARSFALPEGFDPFLPPDDPLVPEPDLVAGFANPGSPSAVRDGDPVTYAESEDGVNGLIRYGQDTRYFGFRLKCEGSREAPGAQFEVSVRAGRLARWLEGNVTPFGVYSLHELPGGDEGSFDEYAVALHDARNRLVNTSTVVDPPDMSLRFAIGYNTTVVKVFAFYPLILNEPLLEGVAKANIRLPASDPSRVNITGYVPPDREHTITGWPGGDFTGAVAQHQYELGRTIIDFEQAGAPTGLPAEAIESARERRASTTALVQTANYSLMMGERQ